MVGIRSINPLARAVGVISAVAVLVTGVTMAAFTTNTVALEENSLSVASDVLRISNGGEFTSPSVTGFSFNNLGIGTESAPQAFYLQNLSNADLALTARQTGTPVYDGVDAGDVVVKIYDQNGTELLSKTLDELTTADQTMGQLDALAAGSADGTPSEGDFTLTITVMQVDNNPGTVNGIDLSFTGTAPEDTL